MNAAEMADNPQLSEYLLKDINADPSLPFEDETFDAVVITVSVQYLTQPVIVFSEVSRILRPGGVFIVTFSNRCFPTKAVRVWRSTNDEDHIELVASYMQHAGGFNGVRGGIANPDMAPPGDPALCRIRLQGNRRWGRYGRVIHCPGHLQRAPR